MLARSDEGFIESFVGALPIGTGMSGIRHRMPMRSGRALTRAGSCWLMLGTQKAA